MVATYPPRTKKTKSVPGSWLFNPEKAALAETTCGNQNYLWHCTVPEVILVPTCWVEQQAANQVCKKRRPEKRTAKTWFVNRINSSTDSAHEIMEVDNFGFRGWDTSVPANRSALDTATPPLKF